MKLYNQEFLLYYSNNLNSDNTWTPIYIRTYWNVYTIMFYQFANANITPYTLFFLMDFRTV